MGLSLISVCSLFRSIAWIQLTRQTYWRYLQHETLIDLVNELCDYFPNDSTLALGLAAAAVGSITSHTLIKNSWVSIHRAVKLAHLDVHYQRVCCQFQGHCLMNATCQQSIELPQTAISASIHETEATYKISTGGCHWMTGVMQAVGMDIFLHGIRGQARHMHRNGDRSSAIKSNDIKYQTGWNLKTITITLTLDRNPTWIRGTTRTGSIPHDPYEEC